MEVKLLSGALGAEINGIDLKDTSLKNFKKINNLLLEHKVIFFRNQNITAEEQLELGKHFGPLEKHVYVKGRKDYPEIVRIVKKPFVFLIVDKFIRSEQVEHSAYSKFFGLKLFHSFSIK